MPYQERTNPISGRMGNKVYYYRKNSKKKKVYCVRRAPGPVNQTAATQRAAIDFGTASKSSRLIRHALHEYTRLCYDNRLHVRLNQKIAEILRADANQVSGQRILTADNMQSLQHFQFNEAANIWQVLKSTPVIEKNNTGKINISLPDTFGKSSHALRNTTHVSIKAIALSLNLSKGTTRKLESNTVVIKRGEQFSPITMTINRRDLTLIILEVQSFYELNGQLYAAENMEAHALDVIEVLAPVEQPTAPKRKYRNKAPHFWLPMPFRQHLLC